MGTLSSRIVRLMLLIAVQWRSIDSENIFDVTRSEKIRASV